METLQDIYEKARRIQDENSKHDPPSEPYKSKYEAQAIFNDLKVVLSGIFDNEEEQENAATTTEFNGETIEIAPSMIRYQLASVRYHLGKIAVDTEEPSTAEEHFNCALSLLEDKETNPEAVWIVIGCYNQLGIIWCNREDHQKAFDNLQLARKRYNAYKNLETSVPPLTPRLIFGGNKEMEEASGWDALEELYTLTLYYLAQVLGHLGKPIMSAKYCLSTLHRQLSSGTYDSLTWAVNAATLAQFFHAHQKYKRSRHLLSAAWTIILNHRVTEEFTPPPDSESEAQERKEKSDEARAIVARGWSRYCLTLLLTSALQHNQENSGTAADESQHLQCEDQEEESLSEEQDEMLEKLEFTSLELTKLENEVPCELVCNFDEARKVFLEGLKWINEAKVYYTLEDHASDYTNLTQDTSTLYKHLADFETAEDRKSKMHKRRVDLLSTVLKELNPQYYLGTCRQLQYELGETHSAMVDCKYSQLGLQKATDQQASKINLHAKAGINFFLDYLESFKDKNGKDPEAYPEDSVRPVLVCYFHLGRLWSKIIERNDEDEANNLVKSLLYYRNLVDYRQKHSECADLIEEEYDVCCEMIRLLPLKIARKRKS